MNRPSIRNVIAALACVAVSGLLAGLAPAELIETVPVGNAGNLGDTEIMSQGGTTGHGSVDYNYSIGKYEVTNAQYVEFLNGVDPTGSNTLGLYSSLMSSFPQGGIGFNGSAPDGSKYSIRPGRANKPVVYVSWYDSIRFANWLHNGQGAGDTENGAYTLGPLDVGGFPINDHFGISRNPGAMWWLPSIDEWYKAAFHKNDGVTGNYWDYPTSSSMEPYSDQPPGSDAPNPANGANFIKNDGVANGYDDGYAVTGSPSFIASQNYLSDVGAYTSATSPYGTFDQAGNVHEWNESFVLSSYRGIRGGSWANSAPFNTLRAQAQGSGLPGLERNDVGLRVARIAGDTQSFPVLPELTSPGDFDFTDVPSGLWFDPPFVPGFRYTMESDSLFTSILEFPDGFAEPFQVIAEGTSLGMFTADQSVDFLTLVGHGVKEFIVSNISPLVDSEDPMAFPLRIAFDTDVASFRMMAIPEPATLLLAAIAITATRTIRRRRN